MKNNIEINLNKYEYNQDLKTNLGVTQYLINREDAETAFKSLKKVIITWLCGFVSDEQVKTCDDIDLIILNAKNSNEISDVEINKIKTIYNASKPSCKQLVDMFNDLLEIFDSKIVAQKFEKAKSIDSGILIDNIKDKKTYITKRQPNVAKVPNIIDEDTPEPQTPWGDDCYAREYKRLQDLVDKSNPKYKNLYKNNEIKKTNNAKINLINTKVGKEFGELLFKGLRPYVITILVIVGAVFLIKQFAAYIETVKDKNLITMLLSGINESMPGALAVIGDLIKGFLSETFGLSFSKTIIKKIFYIFVLVINIVEFVLIAYDKAVDNINTELIKNGDINPDDKKPNLSKRIIFAIGLCFGGFGMSQASLAYTYHFYDKYYRGFRIICSLSQILLLIYIFAK